MATRRLGGIATASSVPDNGGDHSGGGGSGSYVDDVFSTYLYEGTGADRDIVNGIDLADKGGLVWLKPRTTARPHTWFDTERGVLGGQLQSNSSNAEMYQAGRHVTSFNEDGFTIGLGDADTNAAGTDYASWTFAKQEGFFDIVTYTGDGVAGREIPHNLGSEPGMIIVKSLTNTKNWRVYHRSLGADYWLQLNTDDSVVGPSPNIWYSTEPTSKVFTVADTTSINELGGEFVAYLFAHDAPMFGPDGDESIIKCGSYTGTGTDNFVDLGWEPQWLLFKNTTISRDWVLYDAMRGIPTRAHEAALAVNETKAEFYGSNMHLDAEGFTLTSANSFLNQSGNDYIYIAIRRPHKPAEEFEPDELFAMNTNNQTSEPYYEAGFPVDAALIRSPTLSGITKAESRLMQGSYVETNSINAVASDTNAMFDYSTGCNAQSYPSLQAWMFRRASGFFDVVTQDGTSDQVFKHNLGVPPEMIWLKSTSNQTNWIVYAEPVGDGTLSLGTSGYNPAQNGWLGTDTTFTAAGGLISPGLPYIAFLWASVPGICDIGSYTGTGANLNIDCGFTNGARFVLIKRTDSTGDWYYWDTLRGITAGNDPYLLLNTTATQVTTDYIDPLSSGFTVTATAPIALNASGGNYLYMAIA